MDKLKTILTLIAIIVVALGVFTLIGFIYNAVIFIMIVGVVCLVAYGAYRLLRGGDVDHLKAADPHKELKKVERILDEYKRKNDRTIS